MKLFVNKTFSGFYPVGTSAVVIAKTKEDAAKLLSDKLKELHLDQEIAVKDMDELSMKTAGVFILQDGEY